MSIYPFSEGRLNTRLVEIASITLESLGHTIKTSHAESEYDIQEEVEKTLMSMGGKLCSGNEQHLFGCDK
ncbi:hypothetical protein A1OK_16005 [Enterovibrio norvegicus FF-454]|uniref:Uncharacterized protein n=1 Tax=Enterovibrio norvegicus FF-454 TaxID=1185651 RepID=A0A1E5BY63_9GAMM|nr:hypothetical protein [Enterovibrio norvegicus]OEE58216.1 hypothetical protein A1OK_16005 [Enterovibrio norvegicus FF-454]